MKPRQTHETHTQIIKRLKRAAGHLGGIIAMIESHRSCLELAQQLHALECSIANAKKVLIHDHVDGCLEAAANSSSRASRRSLDEFREITKYL